MSLPQQDDDCPSCCECQCDCSFLRHPTFRKNMLTYIFLIAATYLMVSWYHTSSRIPYVRPYRVQLANMNPIWFTTRCLQLEDPIKLTISNFSAHVPTWRASTHSLCRDLYEDFNAMYSLGEEGDASELFKLIQKFDEIQETDATFIASLENKFTSERTSFIPSSYCTLKTNKQDIPSSPPTSLQSNLHYLRGRTVYGRKTMLNKPTLLSIPDFVQLHEEAVAWFNFAYHKDPTYGFPHILLDLDFSSPDPPLAHLVLSTQGYYGFMDKLTTTAIRYEEQRHSTSSYIVDLLKLHNMLGLAVKHEDSYAISYLTPRKNNEIWVLNQYFDQSMHELTFSVLRTLFHSLNISQVSVSIFLPPISDVYPGIHQHLKMPALIRIYTQDMCGETVGIDSMLEMLSTSGVHHDPFRLPKLITRNVVWKYKTF